MRPRLLTTALVAPLLVALAGCSSSAAAPTSSAASSGPGSALPVVSGAFGAPPTVTVPGSTPPAQLRTTVLHQGSGAVIAAGNLVALDYLGEIWKSRKVFDSSFGSTRQPAAFQIGAGRVIPGFDAAIVGRRVGSRLLVVIPPAQGYGKSGNAQAGIAADDTLVFVVDLLGAQTANASAHGTVAPRPTAGLPAVSTGSGKPTITVPHAAAPTRLMALPILRGSGDVVRTGDLVVVQYLGVRWADGKPFDSSWDRGVPAGFGIGVGQVVKGWDEGLVGRHVGDRVLLVVPPAYGYGASGQPSAGISGTDTLVFAVDVLGTYH